MTIASIKTHDGWAVVDNEIRDHTGTIQTLNPWFLDTGPRIVTLFKVELVITPKNTSRQIFHITDNRTFTVITIKDPDLVCQPIDEFCATKDPGEVLDYTIDYTAALEESVPPDSIIASTWVLELSPKETTLVITDDTQFSTLTASVWVSGGAITGLKHKLINHITCASGRQYERTIILRIRSK